MSILIKNATLYDKRSKHHLKKVDIHIEGGRIKKIASTITTVKAKQTISSKNLCVSPGWLDVGAFNGEPGYEQREDLLSLKHAAAQGGYTYVAALPNTQPVIDNKSQIQYLQRKNDEHTTEIIPIACATSHAKGDDIAELIDLTQAGAIAFTDGINSSINKGQLLRTLEYLKAVDGCYIHFLPHNTLSEDGQINEGIHSIQLGLVGIPKVEEYINVTTAVKIAEYAESPLRIHNVTTIDAIKEIKKSNQAISVSVPYLNLIKDDGEISGFDTNLKVLPPLRDKKEQKNLIKQINDGTINCINSNHTAILEQDKDKEFGLAQFGATGISECFAALNTYAKNLDFERLIECLSIGSYEYIGLNSPMIEENEKSVLTVFDREASYEVTQQHPKVNNNPFLGSTLKGRAIAIINGKKSITLE